MSRDMQKFIVKKFKNPLKKDLDTDIKWICNSFGFISTRDQDKVAFHILKALIKAAKEGKGLTSEELTEFVTPTQGSVVYHLNKLMKAGFVVKIESGYELKMNSLQMTINEIEKEILSTLENIKSVSEDIDSRIGLESR